MSEVAAGVDTPDAIARRAYDLFQERGREPGHELDDWLRAEREIMEAKRPNQAR
jgi:hypothetical protein